MVRLEARKILDKFEDILSKVKKKIKIRQGHRAYLTKILGNRLKGIVESYGVNQEKKLKQIRITLNDRLNTLKTLDEETRACPTGRGNVYRDRRCS